MSHWTSLRNFNWLKKLLSYYVETCEWFKLHHTSTKWNLICYPQKIDSSYHVPESKASFLIRWDILLIIFYFIFIFISEETICSDVINYSELSYFSIFLFSHIFSSFLLLDSALLRNCTKSIINHKDVYKSKHMR